jgi:23S rRNA (guanosine2251-2'-O)-methyltransferase
MARLLPFPRTLAGRDARGYTGRMPQPPRPPRPPGGNQGRDRPYGERPQGERDRRGPPGPRPPGDGPKRPPGDGPKRPLGDGPKRPPGDGPKRHQGDGPKRPQEQRRPPPQQSYATPRPPETPRGAVWLYGLHAVDAALGNPARRLRRLVVTEEAEAALLARRPQPWPLTPERTERARIDQLLGRDAVHQGAALLADPLGTPLLATALERPGPILVLDQVSDPRNVGAVLRSAAAFGAAAVIMQDRNAPEETGALAKAASGALETVPLLHAVNLARTLVALKAAGLWTVGLDASGKPLSGPDLAQRRVALVLGAEGPGMRRLVRETCDEVAGLAMPGTMESLNVAAAATVALYELSRRS